MPGQRRSHGPVRTNTTHPRQGRRLGGVGFRELARFSGRDAGAG